MSGDRRRAAGLVVVGLSLACATAGVQIANMTDHYAKLAAGLK